MVIDRKAGTVGARLASVVAQVPDKIAVVENDNRVTYRELDRVATAIAHHVVALAEGRDGCVGLFFDRKLPALESVFGVARSGRPYVPLDAGDPEERLRFILRDCEPVLLLTEAPLLDRARAVAPAGCVVVDIAQISDRETSAPLPEVSADHTLYVSYTSGSTGQPKGVVQTHRNSLFYTGSYARSLNVDASDRLSLLFTMSFSAANNDFYGALLNGATLCAYDARKDGVTHLADWLDRERITILHLVPTVFREMCTRLPPERVLPYLKAVDMTGESTFVSDLDHYRAHLLPQCRFVIQFSASEICLIAQNPIGPDSPLPVNGIVPVGRSPEGVRVTIRRPDGSNADTGEVGDIIVSSAHVSPGYWRRPELNAQTFADSAEYPGWREYKGGDLGLIDAEGSLHFIGRQGGRVKVRGHSVDLMEVEAALATCPGVTQGAVVAEAGEHPGETGRLVAYVVTDSAEYRAPQSIRRHLSGFLPWYMLPAGMVFVDALPLTATGKLDRAALSRLESAPEAPVREVEPPRDDIERGVAAIFVELMGISPVGREDDFFLLGGDSMMGVELQTRLSEMFDVHIGGFHEDATVAGIAGNIRREQATPASARGAFPVLLPLWQQGGLTPMFLVHGRNGQAFVSPHFMQLLGDDQPVWVFQARGLDGAQEPHGQVEDMAFDYLAELRRQRPHGPYFIAALCAGGLIAAIMARSLRAAGETVLPLLLLDPPDRLDGTYEQMSEEAFAEIMQERLEMGRSGGAVADQAFMSAVRRVSVAFDRAITQYRPQPYDGPVLMLSSQRRAYSGDVAGLRKMFSGHTDRYVVGTTHAHALDPHNPAFASALQECLGRIRQTAVQGAGHGATTSRAINA